MSPASLPVDPSAVVAFIQEAYHAKSWTLVVAAVLMVIVRVAMAAKPLAARLPPSAAKWLAVGLAFAGSLGTNLLAGGGWVLALVNGATAGLAAVGTWEVVGQHLPGLKKPPEP